MARPLPHPTALSPITSHKSQQPQFAFAAKHLAECSQRPVSFAIPIESPSAHSHPTHLPADQELPTTLTSLATTRLAPSAIEIQPLSTPTSPTFTENKQSNSNSYKHRQSSLSNTDRNNPASPKPNRGSLFSLATLRDKTSSAIASLTEPALRPQPSSSSLYRTESPGAESYNSSRRLTDSAGRFARSNSPLLRDETQPESLSPRKNKLAGSTIAPNRLQKTNPPSQAYADTAFDYPPPVALDSAIYNNNKMHQTSSRLLRMTSDERPFTRVHNHFYTSIFMKSNLLQENKVNKEQDFKDLFSTLVVSLHLQSHRVRLSRVEHSFLSEEAINNLGSLKFAQSNRMPDPKDTARIVTTTTTTTFSMAREMARSVCQRFLDARFIESADGKHQKEFTMKNTVWQLTPKGIHVLERFCMKNGIQQRHISDVINSSRNTMQLVILERDSATDELSSDRSTVEVIFRRFIGTNGPNIKSSTSSADSDSLTDYKDGIAGVKMAAERKIGNKIFNQTFTGKAASDWLMDCCTTVDRRETGKIAGLFLGHDLIWCVQADRAFLAQFPQAAAATDKPFQPTKQAIYQMTEKGKAVVAMTYKERPSEGDEPAAVRANGGVSRDSNTQKLEKILSDAALRLLFRENLRDTHCEENLSFYLDVDEFLKSCKAAIKANSQVRSDRSGKPASGSLDAVKETMASAYGIYNAFLAPGSPCELNIDHLLRNQLATRMTKSVGQDAAMVESLQEVTALFEEAQLSVFKLMASDSVPKFMKSSKYEQTLKNYDFDAIAHRHNQSGSNLPERSLSRSKM